MYLGDFSPNVRPLHAVAARLHIRLGDLDAAERWARDHDVTASQELSYLREFEHVTLAEILLARAGRARRPRPRSSTPTASCSGCSTPRRVGGRDATVDRGLVLQALAAQARDDEATALLILDRAVRLAEPEGQVRAFTRHGALIVPLLRRPRRGPGRLAPCASAADGLPDDTAGAPGRGGAAAGVRSAERSSTRPQRA